MSDTPERGAPSLAPERIAKVLARAGVASRRDAERLIADGRVKINGAPVTTPATKVTPEQVLTVDGRVVEAARPSSLWRYHKPAGQITTHRDPEGRRTVFEALPREIGRVISVGRLDFASEGLLLLTNDGALARALELPSMGWIRRYRVRVYGKLDLAALAALKDGITIEGVRYGPIEASVDSARRDNAWLTVALAEGKNREVRRVLEHLGLKVNRLIRTAYGPFQLGKLARGMIERVPPKVMREQLGKKLPAKSGADARRRRAA
ncbi:MAG: rRNA pseudouridine synthase [Alphaproteobacteria bacterium]|nr:rRNA pseudouridine synthase [Alphaproteobacteria bacterium]